MGIEEILAAVRRPERTVPVCLRGDLQGVWEQLERDFQAADTDIDDNVLAGGSSAKAAKIAQEMEKVRHEMQASTTIFTFRGLPRSRWQELVSENPAVEGVDEPGSEINEEAFAIAIVAACAIDPTMTAEQAAELCAAVTDGQWQSLVTAAWGLNRSTLDIPYSLAASARLAAIAATDADA